jgi:sugar (pentulose or hexulose) kinase
LVEAFGDGLPARVGQATRTQSSIAKIGWFLQHNVNVTRWLGAAELGLWTLTGEEATEPSLACRTGAFDIRRTCFIEGVVTAVGAPPTVFPPVRRAGDSHGLVSREGAAWLGLPMGIPVTVAGHDHMVGAVGVGVNSADLLDSIGTAETLVRYASSELDLADAVAHGADVSIDPSRGGLAIMAGDLRPGQIVEAVRRMFGDASFEELNRRDQFRELEADSQNASKGDEILEELRTQGPTEAVVRLAGVRWHGLVEAMTAYMWRCAQDIEPLTGPPLANHPHRRRCPQRRLGNREAATHPPARGALAPGGDSLWGCSVRRSRSRSLAGPGSRATPCARGDRDLVDRAM